MIRLAELRKEKKMSQAKLGEILGVSQNTISQWEKGTRDPDTETLKKIAEFFNVPTDYLLHNDYIYFKNLCLNKIPTFKLDKIKDLDIDFSLKNIHTSIILSSGFSQKKKTFIESISSDDIGDETIEELQKYLDYLNSKKAKKDTSTTA